MEKFEKVPPREKQLPHSLAPSPSEKKTPLDDIVTNTPAGWQVPISNNGRPEASCRHDRLDVPGSVLQTIVKYTCEIKRVCVRLRPCFAVA